MTIRSILAVLNGSEAERPMLGAAFDLAIKYQAQLRCLQVSPEPMAYTGGYSESAILGAQVIAAIEQENRKRMQQAKKYFTDVAQRRKVTVQQELASPPLRHASAEFIHWTGDIERLVAHEGHVSDADVHIVDRKGDEVGDVLLAKAKELKAGLLVMGAYGYSRFREIVLGGVTEHVLNHADIPVLMAH